MVLEPARIVEQPATQQPSAAQPSVAPTTPAQGQVGVPGLFGPQGSGQPAANVTGNGQPQAPQQAQPQSASQANPMVDLDRYRSVENELGQYRQAFSQFQQMAQEGQRNQQLQDRLTQVQAVYDSLPADQARQYLVNQVQSIVGETSMTYQQQLQRAEQEKMAIARQISAPLYAKHLADTNGLPQQAQDELLALGDPDLMYRQVGVIKARYDEFNRQLSQFQQNQTQVARAQEVQAMSNAGLGAFGGQTAGASLQLEVSDDPDEAALQILDFQRRREAMYGGAPQYAAPQVPSVPGTGQ